MRVAVSGRGIPAFAAYRHRIWTLLREQSRHLEGVSEEVNRVA